MKHITDNIENTDLSTSLAESLGSEVINIVGNFAEVGLDTFLNEELLKEIPFISTTVSVYRIGRSISDLHNLKKIAIFLNSINNNTLDPTERDKYIKELKDNPKKRSKELEYVLVILDRFIEYDKPVMLSKAYLAYVNGVISWEEFAVFSVSIDRLVPGDYRTLCESSDIIKMDNEDYNESVLRLISLGLMMEVRSASGLEQHDNGGFALTIPSLNKAAKGYKEYKRTKQGERFMEIMGKYS